MLGSLSCYLLFDVPVADSRDVAIIVFVVLKDAVMLEAPIHRWRACHINKPSLNNSRTGNQKQ